MSAAPIKFRWTGESMVPLVTFERAADQAFCIGEVYSLVEHQERSLASHSHYFACVNEAWKNLPESESERFPTAEHLRKWALIKAGFRNEITIACASSAEAARNITEIKRLDYYAVVIARENLLIVYTAQSQSTKAMGKAVFQTSKDEVLTVLAGLLGVTPDALAKNTRAAA